MNTTTIADHFSESAEVLAKFSTAENFEKILQAAALMLHSIQHSGKILSCGNGGSMCDAMHFAEELSGRYRNDRPAIAAIAISDASHISCVGNDYGYDYIFSRYLQALGRSDDTLLAISTSGNSANVLHAVHYAKSIGMKVVALTGKDGGKIGPLADIEIRAPFSNYADRAQEIHIKVIHALIDQIESNL